MGSRVYIGKISSRVRERDLERFFKGFGKIRDVTLKTGYGFVEFEDIRDADDAVYEMNGKELLDQRVVVELSRGPGTRGRSDRYRPLPHRYDMMDRRNNDRRPNYSNNNYNSNNRRKEKYGPPVRTDNRVIVENLSSRVSWQDLKDFMRKAGEVTYADAHRDNKNEGVVEFSSYDEVKRALEKLDGMELYGRKLRLIDNSKKRSRSRSRRRSTRSRSDSRRKRSHSRSVSKRRSRDSKSVSWTKNRDSKDKSLSPDGSDRRKNNLSPNKSDRQSRSQSPAGGDRSDRSNSSHVKVSHHINTNGNESGDNHEDVEMAERRSYSGSPAARSAASRSPQNDE